MDKIKSTKINKRRLTEMLNQNTKHNKLIRGKGCSFFFAVFLSISIMLSLFVGCTGKKENEEELIMNNYSNIYYISEDSTAFPIQFAFKNKIEKIEIFDINTSDDKNLTWEFIEERDSDGKALKIDSYYIYGLIFNLDSKNDFIWQSFSLNINDYFIKTVDLNIEVKPIGTKNEEDDIRPLSIPYISDFADEAEWVFLSMNDIVITSVSVISCLDIENRIFLNSAEYTSDVVVEKADKFYIKILFTDYKLSDRTDKVYVRINYKKNEQDHVYISDYSIFGNQLQLLSDKIINR